MSSPRPASAFNASLIAREQIVGPILLPAQQGEKFVLEFNSLYRRIGLNIRADSAAGQGQTDGPNSGGDAEKHGD